MEKLYMNKKYEALLKIEYVLTGTISTRHGPCGKKQCHCAKGKEHWHGPYHIWTRKEAGKTITKSLSPEQAAFCKSAIENSKKLSALINQWREESLQALQQLEGTK
jgi:purine nucleoside permease